MARVYLTIDDGPAADTAGRIAVLHRNNIPALWFCVGQSLERHADVALELVRRGDVIGNHSYDHQSFSTIGLEECRRQIMKTENVIDELYARAGQPRPAKVFRFPYGEQGHFENGRPSSRPEKKLHKTRLQLLLKELGFEGSPTSTVDHRGTYSNDVADVDWLWSYDVQEWAIGRTKGIQATYEQVVNNLRNYLSRLDGEKGHIVLVHDHQHTARYWPHLIAILADYGIEFCVPRQDAAV